MIVTLRFFFVFSPLCVCMWVSRELDDLTDYAYEIIIKTCLYINQLCRSSFGLQRNDVKIQTKSLSLLKYLKSSGEGEEDELGKQTIISLLCLCFYGAWAFKMSINVKRVFGEPHRVEICRSVKLDNHKSRDGFMGVTVSQSDAKHYRESLPFFSSVTCQSIN